MNDIKVEKKKKKKLSTSAIVLIISLIIILIPVGIFGYIILDAYFKTGTPSFGNRFVNDLNPAITETQKDEIASSIKGISDVEDCEIVLISAQLRINIDAKDYISKESIADIATKAYDVVNSKLPVNTYFTMSSDGEKMYDLAINVYNYVPSSNEDSGWLSYLLTKNSKMNDYETQYISEAQNENLAKELRGEITVEEEATENTEESEETSE